MRKIPTHKFRGFLTRHKVVLLRGGLGLFVVLMLMQFFYPDSRMPLFSSVDGLGTSGWKKDDVVKKMNELSAKQQVAIVVGKSSKLHSKVTPSEIGLKVTHNERIAASNYPWYLRIIPTSLVWFGPLQAEAPAKYSRDNSKAEKFLSSKLGESCNIPAKDATIKQSGSKLVVVPASNGGVCKQAEALKAIQGVKPIINTPAQVNIPVKVSRPAVDDKAAKELAELLNRRTKAGVRLDVAGEKQLINQKEVLSWLTFASEDSKLVFAVNADKANAYVAKTATPKVSKPAGVTKVSTLDFAETSRVTGQPGQTLGIDGTLQSVKDVLEAKAGIAKVSVVAVAPKIEYSRTYTKTSTGIAALLQHYAEDHAGTFGVSFVELGGRGLSASYNSNQSFITASTYKLFVAYSVLARVEKGEWKWSDDVTGGRDLNTCFDDMIVKSDNACAEAMYKKVGYQTVINEARALGLSNTTLAGDGQRTTAADLVTFLTKLENKSIGLKDENRSKLIEAMKRNVYRQGVPAGASGTVADKVGFLNGLLHDASIVYSPKGTYVLVVMTSGSTWGNIAELTRKIEELR